MATAREHMAADLAHVMADVDEAATSIVVDGNTVTALWHAVDEDQVEYEGVLIDRRRLIIGQSDLPWSPVLGKQVVIDGHTWTLAAWDTLQDSWDLILMRYLS